MKYLLKNIGKNQQSHDEGLKLLKQLIGDYELEYNTNGKPYVKNKNIYFNISHSFDKVICCIDDHEIGIDIEKIRDYNHNLNKYLNIKPTTNLEFFKEWTRRESYIKMLGNTVADIKKNIDYKNIDTFIIDDYVISISKKDY